MRRIAAVDGVATVAGGVQGDVSIRDARGKRIGGNLNFVLSTQPEPLDPFA